MNAAGVREAVKRQREFFATGRTRSLDFRLDALRKLKAAVKASEEEIFTALKSDLGRSPTETYIGEVGFLYEEIRYTLKHLKGWAKPRRVWSPITTALSKSRVYYEPLGVVLVIGPWNYPFQLILAPLVGAIAAGNCAVLKPSELAPATSRVLAKIIREAFDPGFVTVTEGGVETSQALLEERFDHIFFTGGANVGRVVLTAAAKYLTPVTLELGGKSPCIVDADTDLELTARRIAWGKFFNAGQTCVAPDYLLVHRSVQSDLLARIGRYTDIFFGKDPSQSPDYTRIINERHFARLSGMLDSGTKLIGGTTQPATRFIAPTVLTDVRENSKVMAEEIFGPILPVFPYDDIDDAIRRVNERPKPLALYFFSRNGARQKRVLGETSFGGGCINDTLVHLSNPRLPFGGVGESGMGAYHGKYSFEVFSHRKGVLHKSFLIDPSLRYPPYGNRLGLFRRLMG
jgi:acyl-CoA reductase-like NAD-dependent aldehyde dehydrogenase